MHAMKKIKSLLFLGLFMMTSCLDILDKEPLDIISDNAVWSDPVLIDSYLAECYYQTSVMVNETPGYFTNGGNFWQSELGMGMCWINEIADEAKVNWAYNTDAVRTYKAGGLTIGGGLLEWWELPYNTIRALNEFIQRVPGSPVAEELKNERVAEAAFELGETGEALEAVNDIRKRAGISPLESVDRDKIRHERKVELAFEGHRYWDVRRWRIAVDVLSKPNSGLRYILDYETGKYQLQILDNVDGTGTSPNFYEHNYYFPITLSRTGNNSNLQENPGYQN